MVDKSFIDYVNYKVNYRDLDENLYGLVACYEFYRANTFDKSSITKDMDISIYSEAYDTHIILTQEPFDENKDYGDNVSKVIYYDKDSHSFEETTIGEKIDI